MLRYPHGYIPAATAPISARTSRRQPLAATLVARLTTAALAPGASTAIQDDRGSMHPCHRACVPFTHVTAPACPSLSIRPSSAAAPWPCSPSAATNSTPDFAPISRKPASGNATTTPARPTASTASSSIPIAMWATMSLPIEARTSSMSRRFTILFNRLLGTTRQPIVAIARRDSTGYDKRACHVR